MKTFGFTDTNEFAEYLADTVDKLRIEENIDVGLCVVAKYHMMKDILNSVIKNTNFELESCEEFDDPILTEYDGEYVLCLDMDDLLVNILKSDCARFDETDIVFVHGDVDSAFVKQNEDSGCIMHEFNIGEDTEDISEECDDDCENCSANETELSSDATASYKVNGKSVDKKTYEKAIEDIEEKYLDGIRDMLLRYCEIQDEMNEWRKLLNW